MIATLAILLTFADDAPALRLFTGAVQKVDGDTITISNAKEDRTFNLAPKMAVEVDGTAARIKQVASGDWATVTYEAGTERVVKISVISAKVKAAKDAEKKKAEGSGKTDAGGTKAPADSPGMKKQTMVPQGPFPPWVGVPGFDPRSPQKKDVAKQKRPSAPDKFDPEQFQKNMEELKARSMEPTPEEDMVAEMARSGRNPYEVVIDKDGFPSFGPFPVESGTMRVATSQGREKGFVELKIAMILETKEPLVSRPNKSRDEVEKEREARRKKTEDRAREVIDRAKKNAQDAKEQAKKKGDDLKNPRDDGRFNKSGLSNDDRKSVIYLGGEEVVVAHGQSFRSRSNHYPEKAKAKEAELVKSGLYAKADEEAASGDVAAAEKTRGEIRRQIVDVSLTHLRITTATFPVLADSPRDLSERIEVRIEGRTYLFDSERQPSALSAFNELLQRLPRG